MRCGGMRCSRFQLRVLNVCTNMGPTYTSYVRTLTSDFTVIFFVADVRLVTCFFSYDTYDIRYTRTTFGVFCFCIGYFL